MISLKIVNNVGEGAAGRLIIILFFKAEDTAILGGVLLPFGSELEIVIHSLVTEVKVIITEQAGGAFGGSDHLCNLLFGAAEFLRLIHSIDIPQSGT